MLTLNKNKNLKKYWKFVIPIILQKLSWNIIQYLNYFIIIGMMLGKLFFRNDQILRFN